MEALRAFLYTCGATRHIAGWKALEMERVVGVGEGKGVAIELRKEWVGSGRWRGLSSGWTKIVMCSTIL